MPDLVTTPQVFGEDLRLDFEPPDTTLLQRAGQKPSATQSALAGASFPAQLGQQYSTSYLRWRLAAAFGPTSNQTGEHTDTAAST